MYAVDLSQRAQKFLEKLDHHIRERIEDSLRGLGQSPVPKDAKFIERDSGGDKIFRIRIGDFRAWYKIKGLR